jgi:carbon storage regulator
MLVLSRKIGERILIGDNIAVMVTKVNGNRVSLGIEAPNDMQIKRGELVPCSVGTASGGLSSVAAALAASK